MYYLVCIPTWARVFEPRLHQLSDLGHNRMNIAAMNMYTVPLLLCPVLSCFKFPMRNSVFILTISEE